MDLPDSIQTYLLRWFVRHYTLGYLLLDRQGRVVSWGGALTDLGVGVLEKGQPAADQLSCLIGLLPMYEESVRLPLIQTQKDKCADIHVFKIDNGYGVLLVDKSRRERRLARLMQKVNNLILMHERSDR